jgi:hypothetical protein
MNTPPPDQITTECMDCGRRYIGPRPSTAPVEAWLYVVHCGCRLPSTDPPFYIDGDGERIEESVTGRGP